MCDMVQYIYIRETNRCQLPESEHVEGEVVSSTSHHSRVTLQLLDAGVRVHLDQARLQQVLCMRGRHREGGGGGGDTERGGKRDR